MDEVSETSGACETSETVKIIETVESKSSFTHVLMRSLTPTGWRVVSICSIPSPLMHHVPELARERLKRGAGTRDCRTGSVQSAGIVIRCSCTRGWRMCTRSTMKLQDRSRWPAALEWSGPRRPRIAISAIRL